MELLSIGEFGRRSRLSAKALRLYDEFGLLVPARVDLDSSAMYEVTTRELPERKLLCLLRNATDQQEVFALGKEFLAIFKERPLPLMDGIVGAPFLIYHGEVSADSDGPVEWCRPVPDDQAADLARRFPELVLRGEPAHEEAFVHLGPAMQVSAAQWQLASESLRNWSAGQQRLPSDLGLRVTYLARAPITPDSQPEIDFAVPLH
jgi:hypothetical protein